MPKKVFKKLDLFLRRKSDNVTIQSCAKKGEIFRGPKKEKRDKSFVKNPLRSFGGPVIVCLFNERRKKQKEAKKI